MLDVLISGGNIVDGTGNPAYYAAVGIEGDRIRILRGDVSTVQARQTIDATGKVVCPGFIDMHAHSGLVILSEPMHEPKVRQGVTTELIGIDGNSYAPFRDQADFERFIELNSGLDGNPMLPGTWSTVAEYLAMFDLKTAINIAYVVGNSPLRINAVGWNQGEATARQLDDMKGQLREAMEEGAFGLSTGLDYPPGSYADTAELIELGKVASRLGGIYHTHVRYGLGDRYLDPFREAIEIGRRSDLPVHITHFYLRVTKPGGSGRLLELVEKSRDEGLDVTFDSYPYVLGSTRLLIVFPEWVHNGGPKRLKEALRSVEARNRLRKEIVPRAATWDDMWLTYFKHQRNHRFEGKSVARVAEMMGKDVVDAMCDLLLDEDLQTSFVMAGADADTLPAFVRHPLAMVGSDALLLGDYPSPRSYGCFPLILGEYVRDNRLIQLPDAIRKMTSYPAQRLGLKGRGILREDMFADVVVFDPNGVRTTATRQDPKQFPIGIDQVLVNGQIVVDNGAHSGRLAGRSLHSGKW